MGKIITELAFDLGVHGMFLAKHKKLFSESLNFHYIILIYLGNKLEACAICTMHTIKLS